MAYLLFDTALTVVIRNKIFSLFGKILKLKITVSRQTDGVNICRFIDVNYHKVQLLLGGLFLPFDNREITK